VNDDGEGADPLDAEDFAGAGSPTFLQNAAKRGVSR